MAGDGRTGWLVLAAPLPPLGHAPARALHHFGAPRLGATRPCPEMVHAKV